MHLQIVRQSIREAYEMEHLPKRKIPTTGLPPNQTTKTMIGYADLRLDTRSQARAQGLWRLLSAHPKESATTADFAKSPAIVAAGRGASQRAIAGRRFRPLFH